MGHEDESPHKVAAIKKYLSAAFPGHEVRHFYEPDASWQSFRIEGAGFGLIRELRMVRGLGPLFPYHHFTVRKAFYVLLRKLGLPRIRLHDLRHQHGSALLAGGVDLAAVSARLGHSSKAFTLQTYLHSMTSAQEHAALVANQLLTHPNGSELRNAASGAGIMERGTGIEPA